MSRRTPLALSVVLALGLSGAAQAAGTLNFANWSDYYPPELLQKFEKDTGIKATLDAYDSNETLLAKLQAVFGSKTDAQATPPAPPKTDHVAATPEQLNQFSTVVATQLSEFKTQLDGLKSEFGELKTALSKQPAENNPSRPPATGATDYQKTDC